MVKFKVGFTVTAETLFGIMAKFLPVEDLHVEEVLEQPNPNPKWRPYTPKSTPPKISNKPRKKWPHRNIFAPDKGINGIILGVLEDGEAHYAFEMKGPAQMGGYSPNSIASRLVKLKKRGLVMQPEVALWKKVEREAIRERDEQTINNQR